MEKYEERVWLEIYDWRNKESRDIAHLPLMEEEYRVFFLLLLGLALKYRDQHLCEMYFKIQMRKRYA